MVDVPGTLRVNKCLADHQKSKDLTELRILASGYLRYMEAKAHL